MVHDHSVWDQEVVLPFVFSVSDYFGKYNCKPRAEFGWVKGIKQHFRPDQRRSERLRTPVAHVNADGGAITRDLLLEITQARAVIAHLSLSGGALTGDGGAE